MRTYSLAAIALVFAGSFSCSIGGFDYAELETAIKDGLEEDYGEGLAVDEVSCPEQEEDPGDGDTFICNATVADQDVRVEVSVTSDDGDVTFRTLDVVFQIDEVESLLSEDVAAQVGVDVTVECDGDILVVPTGGTFDCTATDVNGETSGLTATAEEGGELSWELTGP